ncbi:PREDICTED: mas-related G-protein coupled receptor member H-like [Gekko japonicus]|uniref:Mas-related G-protein coupled receptor member H-like n=1 Tax=Gekko japonicus TaxID=146911 RepID=A0ABM1JI61_GEKJA|nr:PREDICTED: mas-related G-protein coupled receptor member H-like [Gekko japonicus]
MANFSKTPLDSMEVGTECCEIHNDSGISINESTLYNPEGIFHNYLELFVYIFGFVLCIIGIVGNGIVIWLLGFCIKRNPFTIYILNLASADFGLLVIIAPLCILDLLKQTPYLFGVIVGNLNPFAYTVGQLLLTVISIDRCVVVLFPIWHRCHRPTHWSTIVCAFIWILCFLLYGVRVALIILKLDGDYVLFGQVLVYAMFCLPLITISTATLLFKICCKRQQHQRGKLLLVISLTLLFFLIFAFPLSAIFLFNYLSNRVHSYLYKYGNLCAILNSTINPVIYFLVGRKKKSQTRETMKVILQRVFKQEEECKEGLETAVPT